MVVCPYEQVWQQLANDAHTKPLPPAGCASAQCVEMPNPEEKVSYLIYFSPESVLHHLLHFVHLKNTNKPQSI